MRLFETKLARSLLALAALVVLGIAGYMLIEGWSLFDAAYMVVVTFTTVGYEEVHPLSPSGRLLTMFMMVAGVGVMLYILTSVVHMVVAQEVLRKLGPEADNEDADGKTKRPLHRMRLWTRRQGRLFHPTGGVGSSDRDRQGRGGPRRGREQGLLCVHGDPTRDADLISAHVEQARGLVAATGDDTENVYISLTARGLNPNLHIVARASRPDAEDKLRRAGADQVISPYTIGGRQMALSAIEGRPRPEPDRGEG